MTPDEVETSAKRLAREIIADAKRLAGPVVWLTGNSYMPPLRSFPAAEAVWQLDNEPDPWAWELFTETLESELEAALVLLECPDYDNALYAVDLARWDHIADDDERNPDFDPNDMNSEWIPRQSASGQ